MRRAVRAIAQGALPILTRLGPEFAHDAGLAGLRWLGRLWPPPMIPEGLAVHCFGLRFAHPLGLAAGFDKNGDYLDALGALGFSHIELGTVTPRPQPGNSKPRMFRIPGQCALINRMGFNNKGVDHLVARISRARYGGIRGISIGKNFDTPLEQAHEDYLTCLRKIYPLADYVAVNVSSPIPRALAELRHLTDCGGYSSPARRAAHIDGASRQTRAAVGQDCAPDLSERRFPRWRRKSASLRLTESSPRIHPRTEAFYQLRPRPNSAGFERGAAACPIGETISQRCAPDSVRSFHHRRRRYRQRGTA